MSQSATTGQAPTVLIVEDEARVRGLFRTVLEGLVRVLEASDGDQALKIIQDGAGRGVDLVLADHRVPKRSGLEVLRLSRQLWPWIPVVLITGYGSEQLAIEALRAGATDYLKKPVDVTELKRVVLAHARTRRLPAEPGANRAEASAPFPEEASATHLGIRRALAFVQAHFTEPITLSQVAGEAGLSKFHFCRLFRRQAGQPFREYVRCLRIDQAKTLLADRRMTITEVAYATGFDDLSHFDNVFNRMVGVSPTGYRKAIWSV